jgi:hypothetical protein
MAKARTLIALTRTSVFALATLNSRSTRFWKRSFSISITSICVDSSSSISVNRSSRRCFCSRTSSTVILLFRGPGKVSIRETNLFRATSCMCICCRISDSSARLRCRAATRGITRETRSKHSSSCSSVSRYQITLIFVETYCVQASVMDFLGHHIPFREHAV